MSIKLRKILGISASLLGVICIMYGAHRGEIDTVFSKAIRICLECIGIG